MEAISPTFSKIIISNTSPRTLIPINKAPFKLSFNSKRSVAAARCVASGSSYAEPITPEEEEEELTQRKGICGGEGNREVWELLECLEKEAIMGDDDGREPKDYNRRAKIFDKSSKIFKNKEEKRDQSPE